MYDEFSVETLAELYSDYGLAHECDGDSKTFNGVFE